MTVGSFTALTSDTIIIAADQYRDEVELQWISGGEAFIAFGMPAEANKGMKMNSTSPYYRLTGPRATLAVHMIAVTTPAVGGYATA
jgi:hypothetical protein